MTYQLDFTGPEALRTRGTVVVVPGRGETAGSYRRFGARIAADSYRVRVLDRPVPATSADESVASLASALDAGLAELDPGLVRPLVLIGSDSAAAALAALVARPAPDAAWWPDALVLAALPGHGGHDLGGSWQAELDSRSHCPAHRSVLTDDTQAQRGTLATALDDELLDQAYGSTAGVPILLLVGDEDPLADREALAVAAKGLPAARLSVVHAAHHDVLNDLQHRSVAAEVVTFLEVVRNGRPLEAIVSTQASAW